MKLSKITLGTAQLGLDYGISNKNGKPNISSAQAILDLAYQQGVNVIDTAGDYGDSENIIGNYLASHPDWQPNLITKFKLGRGVGNGLARLVAEKIETRLKRLKQKSIYGVMLHDYSDLQEYGQTLVDILARQKQLGIIQQIGISVYDAEELAAALSYDELTIFQAPVNIFNQNILKSGLLSKMKPQGKLFFARSIYLQGLFFLTCPALPIKVAQAAPCLSKLCRLSQKYNREVSDLVFAFVRDIAEIDSLVIGVETTSQLQENLTKLSTGPLIAAARQEIIKSFQDLSAAIYDPRKWGN
jgi:aryl-alcohol dehydrogenase-like predicted oxidoreductase